MNLAFMIFTISVTTTCNVCFTARVVILLLVATSWFPPWWQRFQLLGLNWKDFILLGLRLFLMNLIIWTNYLDKIGCQECQIAWQHCNCFSLLVIFIWLWNLIKKNWVLSISIVFFSELTWSYAGRFFFFTYKALQ